MTARGRAAPAGRADEGSIAPLIEREAPALLAYFARRLIEREDAADLLAELLVVAWRRRAVIPADPTAARMWLFGVARKTLARHRRGAVRRSALAGRLRADLAARAVVSRSAGSGADDLARRVRELVVAMPEPDREIIALSYWDGFSFVEIARLLRMPSATVRSRHGRAKARLRAVLIAEGYVVEPTGG